MTRIVWQHPVDGILGGAFIEVCGSYAVFQFWRKSRGQAIAAVAVDTGTIAWTTSVSGVDDFFVHDSRLYTGGDRARCLAADTGETIAELPPEPVTVLPPVTEGPVFFRSEALLLTILHPDSLEPVWEFPDPDEQWTAHNDKLCSRGGEIVVLDRTTRAELARLRSVAPPGAALHTHCSDLWCEFGVSGGGRRAYDLKTGRLVWQVEKPAAYDLPDFSPTHAYVATDGVTAYDLRTGQAVWSQPLESPASRISTGRPHRSGTRLFTGTQSGTLYVLDTASGGIVQRLDLGFVPRAVRPVDDARLLVASEDSLYCISRS